MARTITQGFEQLRQNLEITGGYLIPGSIQKRWIETDPKRHVEIWTEANKKHGYKLVPIIKMVKAWNKLHSELLRSFSLEDVGGWMAMNLDEVVRPSDELIWGRRVARSTKGNT